MAGIDSGPGPGRPLNRFTVSPCPWPSPFGRLLRRRLPGLSCPVIEPLVLRTQRPSSDQVSSPDTKNPAKAGL